MPQTFQSLCAGLAPVERDAELERLEAALAAFNRRPELAPIHHWTPELRAERWAVFSLHCRELYKASSVPVRFATIDLLRLEAWLPKAYGEMAAMLLELRDKPKLTAIGGARGRGKTGMACGLVRAFCRLGRPALYARVRDFFDALDGVPWAEKTAVKERYAKPDLLVLDEVQVRDAGKGWQDNDLTTLIDRRYSEERATVLLSNLNPAALVQNLGDSVHRRLNEEGQIWETNWPQLDPLRQQYDQRRRNDNG